MVLKIKYKYLLLRLSIRFIAQKASIYICAFFSQQLPGIYILLEKCYTYTTENKYKALVLSVTLLKRIKFKVFFSGRKQKSIRLRECKWSLFHQQGKEIRALKQHTKWKKCCLSLKFSSIFTVWPVFWNLMLVSISYNRRKPMTNRKSNGLDICFLWLQHTPHWRKWQEGFFYSQDDLEIQITYWDPIWYISNGLRANADLEHTKITHLLHAFLNSKAY